jgi:hypothetical protein
LGKRGKFQGLVFHLFNLLSVLRLAFPSSAIAFRSFPPCSFGVVSKHARSVTRRLPSRIVVLGAATVFSQSCYFKLAFFICFSKGKFIVRKIPKSLSSFLNGPNPNRTGCERPWQPCLMRASMGAS